MSRRSVTRYQEIAADEMQHPMVGAAEADGGREFRPDRHKVPVGKEKQLDQFDRRRGPGLARGRGGVGRAVRSETGFTSVMLTFFGPIVTQMAPEAKGSVSRSLRDVRSLRFLTGMLILRA